MVLFTFDRTVKADREQFFDWWSDFTSNDHAGPNWPPKLAQQRTVREQDDRHAVIDDVMGNLHMHSAITKNRPDGLESTGESRIVSMRRHVVFTPVPDGTRLHVEIEFTPHGIAKLLFPVGKRRVFSRVTEDLETHIKDFYTDTGRQM
jgi:hypothetical protein